MPILPINPL